MKIITTDNYNVAPEDFNNGNDSVDASFKDFEHTRFDLALPEDGLVGYIIISYQKDNTHFPHPFVRYVFINPEFRGNKYSLQLYTGANDYTISRYNQALASDQFNWISRSASKIWETLCDQGLATKNNNRYVFINS